MADLTVKQEAALSKAFMMKAQPKSPLMVCGEMCRPSMTYDASKPFRLLAFQIMTPTGVLRPYTPYTLPLQVSH